MLGFYGSVVREYIGGVAATPPIYSLVWSVKKFLYKNIYLPAHNESFCQ